MIRVIEELERDESTVELKINEIIEQVNRNTQTLHAIGAFLDIRNVIYVAQGND